MAESKRKYWLKLNKDFLKSPQIKVIKGMQNGKDYIIFYLALMLESIETVGHLRFTSFVPYNAEMLASVTDTNVDIVRSATKIFCELGLMQIFDDGTIFMPQVPEMTGKECESAERVRQFRQKLAESGVKKIPKTNALRQKQFRAKQFCEGKQHIPYIEQDKNNQRYNGNYYVVFKRDKLKCAVCGSIENLCVHHIDGYDENKPENNNENKLITLCRSCHRNIHENNLKLSEEILESIDYYDECNENNEICNTDVTECNSNINKDKDIDIDKEINKEKNKDIFCNQDYDKCFNIYKEVCTKLIPLRFERRSKAIIEQLSNFLDEIEYNFDYFKELCVKANELEKIADNKIDFKMLLNNHIGITNGKYKKEVIEYEY